MGTMVDYPQSYFKQWIPSRSALLSRLETEAFNEQIPIVGPVVGQLLFILVRLFGPHNILELGTATGYSAIYLAEGCRHSDSRIISLEKNTLMADRARANLRLAGLARWVDVRCADALETLHDLQGPLDMIFMDIDKTDYIRALPACRRILRPNGLLVADNTGFAEADRFNRAIYEDQAWCSINLWTFLPGHSPENDGLCLALRV